MKTKRSKKTGVLKFRIDAETYDSLKRHCAGTSRTMSVVLRDILERELAKGCGEETAEEHAALPVVAAQAASQQIRFEQ